jgi:hypothetical protein
MSSGSGSDPRAPEPDDRTQQPALPPYPGQPPYPQQAYPGQPPYPGHYAPPSFGPRFDPADPLVSNDWSGWWRRGMTVVRRGWRTLLLLQLIGLPAMALTNIPLTIWSDRISVDLDRNAATGSPSDLGAIFAGLGPVVLAMLVGGLLYGVVQLATARAVASVATGRPTSAGAELAAGLRRLPALVGWWLLAVPILLLAVLLCVLPVFYVSAVLLLLQAIVVFERGNAIARCFQLFHTDLGTAVGRLATVWGLFVAVGIALALVTSVITLATLPAGQAYDGGALTGSIVSGVLQCIGALVTGVLFTPLIVLAYTDLRARREPFTTDELLATAGRA